MATIKTDVSSPKRLYARPPGREAGAGRRNREESSKRQQCENATELAGRTGLKSGYAGLSKENIENENSGKAFDVSGRNDCDYTIKWHKPDEKEPSVTDCSDENIPRGAEDSEGKRKVVLPVITSMTKYLFDHYRLTLYSYVNRLLKMGELSRITGERVENRIFNHTTLSFPDVSYWKLDREYFLVDVRVDLKLETKSGIVNWRGVITASCGFLDKVYFKPWDLRPAEAVDRKEEGYVRLSPYLVPYYTNVRVDEIADRIWKKYKMEDALTDPLARDAEKLAAAMGLKIEYRKIFNHGGIDSILFFKGDTLELGEDRTEKLNGGAKRKVRADKGEPEYIEANTIVVNTNRIRRDYSRFNIYHECIHYEEHYLFFRLQEMTSSDPRRFDTVEVEVDAGKEIKDPIYFIEKQANRGAYALMMPALDTKLRITEELRKAGLCKNAGERFEKAGLEVARKLGVPHFRMRARMIQLGYIEAKGALNYVNRMMIRPFAFDVEAWREEQHTFIIDEVTLRNLCRNNKEFRAVMCSGDFVYADGHVVKNDPRFVYRADGGLLLTDEALAHIDDCCLRFVNVYVQRYAGRYVFGRMYYDADYAKQTKFYLDDLINKENLDEYDAKRAYIERFPREFKKAVEMLRKQNHVSNAALAEYFQMDDSTFGRWLDDPKYYRNEDFLTMLCLYFRLPDWISRLVFKRAHFDTADGDRRLYYLMEVLRLQSADGLDAANEYLKGRGVEPLHV